MLVVCKLALVFKEANVCYLDQNVAGVQPKGLLVFATDCAWCCFQHVAHMVLIVYAYGQCWHLSAWQLSVVAECMTALCMTAECMAAECMVTVCMVTVRIYMSCVCYLAEQLSTLEGADALGSTCLQISLERLLLETDAPDGKPRLGDPYQEKLVDLVAQNNSTEQDMNHPANIRYVHTGLMCRMLHSCMNGQQ